MTLALVRGAVTGALAALMLFVVVAATGAVPRRDGGPNDAPVESPSAAPGCSTPSRVAAGVLKRYPYADFTVLRVADGVVIARGGRAMHVSPHPSGCGTVRRPLTIQELRALIGRPA